MVDLKSGLEIEVLSAADAARRRQWSEADKLRIVEASFAGRRLVSATARSYGISRSLLTTYVKRLDHGRFVWPTPADGAVAVSAAQLGYLLEGIDWRNPRHTWRPSAAG